MCEASRIQRSAEKQDVSQGSFNFSCRSGFSLSLQYYLALQQSSSHFGRKPTTIQPVNRFNCRESCELPSVGKIFFPLLDFKQTQWSLSAGPEKKGNLGPLVVFGDQAGPSVTGSGFCWLPNTLWLCRTRSCLLTSASAAGLQRRSFAWIFSGLMRMRGQRTAGQKQ